MNDFSYVQYPDQAERERIMLKFRGMRPALSDTLRKAIREAYEASDDTDGMLSPAEAESSWVVLMSEQIGILVRASWPGSSDLQRTHFSDYFSCVLRGINPVSKSQIRRSKMDGDYWHYVRWQAAGENAIRPINI